MSNDSLVMALFQGVACINDVSHWSVTVSLSVSNTWVLSVVANWALWHVSFSVVSSVGLMLRHWNAHVGLLD